MGRGNPCTAFLRWKTPGFLEIWNYTQNHCVPCGDCCASSIGFSLVFVHWTVEMGVDSRQEKAVVGRQRF